MSKVILFQGDSITDCSRGQGNPTGIGYPFLVEAALGADYPGEYSFFNRGISGNRIVDVYARIKADIINLKPDYMSILIGINDVWHDIDWKNGVDTPKFEKIYSMLIEEVKAACPDIKITIMTPYVLEGPGTKSSEERPDRFERFKAGTAEKIDACKRIAEKYGLPTIELQPVFDEALKRAPASFWSADGVHPTANGHELIKRCWIENFEATK